MSRFMRFLQKKIANKQKFNLFQLMKTIYVRESTSLNNAKVSFSKYFHSHFLSHVPYIRYDDSVVILRNKQFQN